jgi:hypothetical protein
VEGVFVLGTCSALVAVVQLSARNGNANARRRQNKSAGLPEAILEPRSSPVLGDRRFSRRSYVLSKIGYYDFPIRPLGETGPRSRRRPSGPDGCFGSKGEILKSRCSLLFLQQQTSPDQLVSSVSCQQRNWPRSDLKVLASYHHSNSVELPE